MQDLGVRLARVAILLGLAACGTQDVDLSGGLSGPAAEQDCELAGYSCVPRSKLTPGPDGSRACPTIPTEKYLCAASPAGGEPRACCDPHAPAPIPIATAMPCEGAGGFCSPIDASGVTCPEGTQLDTTLACAQNDPANQKLICCRK